MFSIKLLKRFRRYIQCISCRHYDKVLFLDFDGVLAPIDGFREPDGDTFGRRFDQTCMENLKRLITASGANIVITSSWREYLSLPKMLRMWEYRGLPDVLAGVTPVRGTSRSQEIDSWLAHHSVHSFAILDDMDKRQFDEHHHSRLITCNGRIGLSADDVKHCIEVLNCANKSHHMHRYIFLDIDGPLNTGRNDYLNPEKYLHHFDEEAVQNLRTLIDRTGAKIVISSSWRHMGLERIRELWREWGLPGEISGCTPGFWGDTVSLPSRGDEIKLWLTDNAPANSAYVIFDDYKEGECLQEQNQFWIKVDPHCGISEKDIVRAENILLNVQ